MILFALALVAASPEAAAQPAAPAPAAPAPAVAAAKPADDLDRVVCHVDEETGTRLGSHKECHTKREWIQNQNETANSLNRATSTH
jgi:hypothetical protein